MGQSKAVKTITHAEVQQWYGPIPAPESLSKYESIIPGAAERILSMAEREQKHRQEMEKDALRKRSNLAMTSTIFAFISLLALIVLVAYAIYKGDYGLALATVITAIVAVVGAFGAGKFYKSREKR